jgi:hypothetical protein
VFFRWGHIAFAGAFSIACDGAERRSPESEPPDGLGDDAGWGALLDWEGIPRLGAGSYRGFSSYDRDPNSAFLLTGAGNKDFNNFLAVCGDRPALLGQTVDGTGPCDPGLDGYLIAASDDGPGYVSRIFLAAASLNGNVTTVRDIAIGFANERIRIYIDGSAAPVYDGVIADWVSGRTEPFPAELTRGTSGAVVSYAPISYRSNVRVFLDELRVPATYFYQVDLQSVEHTVSFDAQAVSAAGARRLVDLRRARDGEDAVTWRSESLRVPAGGSVELLSRSNAGTIRRLELAFEGVGSTAPSDLTLRAVWDGEPAPAIEVPLSRLFATAPSPASFDTLPMSVQFTEAGVSLTLRLPMPFASRAALSLVNRGAVDHEVLAHIHGTDGPPRAGFGRLYVYPSEQSAPVLAGSRFVIADLQGRGKYAGTVFSFKGTRDPEFVLSDAFNFLEGDETMTVDGVVAARGTGTEEFVNGGFYFIEGLFDFAFSAAIATETEALSAGELAGRARGARWHVLSDAVGFEESFRLEFEYGADRPVTMLEYSAVAFSYRE